FHRGVHVGALRDIAAYRDGRVADRCRGRARGLPIDIDDGNARAFAREGGGNALAETRCSAGDERNLVVETHATSFLAPLFAAQRRTCCIASKYRVVAAHALSQEANPAVMRGLDPRIHPLARKPYEDGCIAGSSPAMTTLN